MVKTDKTSNCNLHQRVSFLQQHYINKIDWLDGTPFQTHHKQKQFPLMQYSTREKSIHIYVYLCFSLSAVALFRPQLLKAASREARRESCLHAFLPRETLCSLSIYYSIIKMRPSHEISEHITHG